jgi:hypothetical protein
MEKTFLKIARYALTGVIALSLALTVIAVVYGAFQFLPSSQPKTPKITVKLKDMTRPKVAPAAETAPAPSSGNESGATKQCEAVAPKMNNLVKQIGWEKKTESNFNPSTMLFETKSTVDYNESINTSVYCSFTQSFIEEQNSKLTPYFKQIDLHDSYFENLNAFLDEMAADAQRNQALQPDDASRYYFSASLQWFNIQFSRAVDEARDGASLKEVQKVVAKDRGKAALYLAGSSFGFFFACCLILVFMRIEVDAKDLVEAVRALDHKEENILPNNAEHV